FTVRTRLGREIRTTASHPFLTPAGWKPLASLVEGDVVAVPSELPVFGAEPLPGADVGLLGYLVGAGIGGDPGPGVRCTDEVVALDLGELAGRVGLEVHRFLSSGEARRFDLVPGPALARLVHEHKVAAAPARRRVPEAVYRLPRHQLAAFLNRAFAVGASTWTGGDSGRVTFTTTS